MCLLIIVTIGLLGILAGLSIATLKALYPNYFERFAWSMVLLSITFEMLMLILLSALSFLFASFTSSSFITLVLTVITYIIGQSLSDVKALVEAPQVVGIHVSPVTVKTVQAAYYLFPNLSLFDIKLRAAHNLALPLSQIFWTLSYGVIYCTLAIAIASLVFRRREFP
jgi:ABC-type transport system involved in multi-copper enzyme maturation permease subunit